MKIEDFDQPNEFPLSNTEFNKLVAEHQARPFYPNCYKCQRQSAIVGCSSRDDGLCTGTELFIERETESTPERYPCECPKGSLCEFFDKEHEICRYREI